MKCPVCDKEITDRQMDYMEHVLTEEYISCKDDHHFFHSMYAYGSTQETVGAVTFTSHYNATKEERDLLNRQFASVVALERESYIEKIAQEGKENS